LSKTSWELDTTFRQGRRDFFFVSVWVYRFITPVLPHWGERLFFSAGI